LFQNVLISELAELSENNVRLKFLGYLAQLPPKLQASINRAMDKTAENTGLKLQVAINYGSRLEITQAVRTIADKVASGVITADQIDEEMISKHLYTDGIPDPELLIRTGGEMRLSNYLLWQSAYTELFVTSTLWPDFSANNFEEAISEFCTRQRRYGA
jgi:undecaprenyl diphosphate synthase